MKTGQRVSYLGCDFIVLEVDKNDSTVTLDAVNKAMRGYPRVAPMDKVYTAISKKSNKKNHF